MNMQYKYLIIFILSYRIRLVMELNSNRIKALIKKYNILVRLLILVISCYLSSWHF